MHVLFVCSGNVCRSPMAEGIARDRYSDRATFASAGTMAVTGASPTHTAVVAAAEIGVDLTRLRASSVPSTLDPLPDRVYVMTAYQLSQVEYENPALVGRVELLDPEGSIADPYGLDLSVYRATRDHIAQAIDSRAEDWT